MTNILDEPSAANAIYQIEDGVVVDIGGGTTGLAILKEGKVVQIEDEHRRHPSDPGSVGQLSRLLRGGGGHQAGLQAPPGDPPVVRPVVEKMATIVSRYVDKAHTDTIYLCGGTCCLAGIETSSRR